MSTRQRPLPRKKESPIKLLCTLSGQKVPAWTIPHESGYENYLDPSQRRQCPPFLRHSLPPQIDEIPA